MINFRRFHFSIIGSTNDYAKELLDSYPYVLVTADYQTLGRGRNKNVWLGEFGKNIYLSLGIRHEKELRIEETTFFQGFGSLVSKNVLSEIEPNLSFKLKYPNDVFVKSSDKQFKKISGVLVEHVFMGEFCTATIVGIGINVNQKKFPSDLLSPATSLSLETTKEYDLEVIIDRIKHLAEELLKLPSDELLQLWFRELNIVGKDVKVLTTGRVFRVVDIDKFGRLVAENIDFTDKIIIDNGESIRYEFEE